MKLMFLAQRLLCQHLNRMGQSMDIPMEMAHLKNYSNQHQTLEYLAYWSKNEIDGEKKGMITLINYQFRPKIRAKISRIICNKFKMFVLSLIPWISIEWYDDVRFNHSRYTIVQVKSQSSQLNKYSHWSYISTK